MCIQPKLAARLCIKSDDNKAVIKFLNPMRFNFERACDTYGFDNVLLIPCGECSECKRKYKRDWSIRCMAEASYHKENCFITLTYDNEHYGSLNIPKDFQDFMKRLRARLNKDIKFFACSEAGTTTLRYHWHAIIFGWFPDDVVLDYENELGDKLYKSKLLNEVWSKGFCNVGEVSKEACGYVAGYTAKKENPILPGKLLMSRKPGLGYQYFVDNYEKILKTGSCVIPGFGIVSVPRYGLDIISKFANTDELKKRKIELMHHRIIADCVQGQYEYIDMAIKKLDIKRYSRKRGL